MSQKAYMIGTGIGNLAAALYLIRDGHWRGEQITLFGLEQHGANDGAKVSDYEDEYSNQTLSNNAGYMAKGGRMLNEETYENLWDLMSYVPSLDHPGQSVTEEILEFDHAHPTHDVARLMDSKGIRNRGDKNDYSHMQFNNLDRYWLTRLMMLPESKEEELNDITIAEWFKKTPHIFKTNFWYMWETTFAFKKREFCDGT